MVALIVSCFQYNNTGMGGHYYTAFSVFQGIQTHVDSVLIVIGDHQPAAIDFSLTGTTFIRVSRRITQRDVKKLNIFLLNNKINVLHSFDTYAFLLSRLAKRLGGVRTILTKCGGPRPIFHYYPGFCPDTVFSPEDQAYFTRRARWFKVQPPVLLPNRVGMLPTTRQATDSQDLPPCVHSNAKKIIRIARICRAYEQSIFQTIALAASLRAKGIRVALYIVGYIQDPAVFNRVKKAMTTSDFLLTDVRYTRNASRHIDGVDLVVASGRGVMEASVLKKIILCSVKDANHPYLLDASTFSHFFQYNFSSRAGKPDIPESRNLKDIVTLLTNETGKELYCRSMRAIHDQYFNISTAIPSYLMLYKEGRVQRESWLSTLDTLIHWLISTIKLGMRKLQHFLVEKRCSWRSKG